MKFKRSARKRSKAEQRARLNAATLREKYTRTELEYERGYKLFKLWSENEAILDPAIGIFWVSKVNLHGLHKGDKILNKADMLSFVSKGGKVREIHCYKDKATNEVVRLMAKHMDVPVDGQHGFTASKNVFTNMGEHLNADTKAVLNIDLEDAFHQVSQEDVFHILRQVFDINRATAAKMAAFFCENGRLFQGCPVSPLLFNIYTARLAKSMKGIKWLQFSQYADDLTFSLTNEYIGFKLIKWLIRIIEDCGCKANPSKVIRQRLKEGGKGGEITGIKLWHKSAHHWRTKPRNGKSMANNIRLFDHLIDMGITHSKRLNKQGKPILLEQIKDGLKHWELNATANT